MNERKIVREDRDGSILMSNPEGLKVQGIAYRTCDKNHRPLMYLNMISVDGMELSFGCGACAAIQDRRKPLSV